MPASAKGTARTGQRQQSCCRNPGWVSLWVPDSETEEREAVCDPKCQKKEQVSLVKKGSEAGSRGGGGSWQGACAVAVIFMEKAIKPCSLINGHHQDLFPAQIKLKVMDGATSSRQSWWWLRAE